MARENLPRGERLRGRAAIQRLMRAGHAVEDALLVLRYLPSGETQACRRIAVAVSRSHRGAIARNRVRRRIREIYRRGRSRLPETGDFLIIAKGEAFSASYRELEAAFQNLSDELAD